MKQMLKEIDKKVYFATYALVLVVIGLIIAVPDQFRTILDAMYGFIVGEVGWLYIFICVWCCALFCVLSFGKFGNLKLGAPEEKPRFSTFSWASMIFTSGIGSSVIIYGFAEPVYYLTQTPFGIEPMSTQAYEYAHMYGQVHWGLACWVLYLPGVFAVAYMLYHRNSYDAKLSNTMTPLFGKKFAQGWAGKIVDTVVALTILSSVVTSLGLGVPVLSRLISEVLGVEENNLLYLSVFGIWFMIFGWSVFQGLEKGIRRLTNWNMYLIFAFLILFCLVTPFHRFLKMELNTIGLMLTNLPRIVFYTDPFGDGSFVNNWTVFYWAWILSFVPTMGVFIAKISRGRTMKQVVIGQTIYGTLGCCTFFVTLGGYSLYLQHSGIVDLSAIGASAGNAGIVLAAMKTLPLAKGFMALLVILCFVFLATTIDSTALALATATCAKLAPDEDPHLFNRFGWAMAIFALSIALFLTGGLPLIQEFAIIIAFPLIFVIIVITVSVFKAMREDYGEMTAEEIRDKFRAPKQ